MDIRTISLASHFSLPLPHDAVDSGGIYPRAMLLGALLSTRVPPVSGFFCRTSHSPSSRPGDVDGDGCNELLYAMPSGQLFVFKDQQLLAAWRTDGSITCLAVGEATNSGQTEIAVFLAEGRCIILTGLVADGQFRLEVRVGSGRRPPNNASNPLQTTGTVYISVNAKSAAIADADGDGLQEIVVGRSDRIVEIYRVKSPNSRSAVARVVVDGAGTEGAAVVEPSAGQSPLRPPLPNATASPVAADAVTAVLLRTVYVPGQVGGGAVCGCLAV
jgi:hypothetical protein